MPAAFDAYFEAMDEQLLAVMGEECSYVPKAGGGARTVTAAVEEDSQYADNGQRVSNRQTLNILVMRDPEHASYGGIAAPELGDSLTREGESEAYTFRGVRREVSTTAWVLEFDRTTTYAIGGNRRP